MQQVSLLRMQRKPKSKPSPKRARARQGNGSSSRSSPAASKARIDDPVVANVQAQVKPFDVPRGVASPLADGRPCQKMTARGQAVVTIPIGCTMVFMCSPNISSATTSRSVVFAVQTAAGVPMSGSFQNGVVGNNVVAGGTLSYISTQTPYDGTYLTTNNIEYALSGSGLRFTYDGAELYRGGTFRYYHDLDSDLTDNIGNWTVDGPADVITKVDGSINSIRQSINNNNIVEINSFVIKPKTGYIEAGGATNTAYAPDEDNVVGTIGGTISSSTFGVNPMTYGYYVNGSAAAVTFYVEAVEHWSLHGGPIQTLQTPSYANITVAEHVATFLATSRQAHSTQPNIHHVDVMKSTVKAAKSPMGSELLNLALKSALA